MDKPSKFENLSDPPKSQYNNSIFYLTIAGPLLSALAYILLLKLSSALLTPEDAKPVKDMLAATLGLTGAATAAGGPIGLIARSLMLTNGKIKSQAVQTDDGIQDDDAAQDDEVIIL